MTGMAAASRDAERSRIGRLARGRIGRSADAAVRLLEGP
ncbi:hypothetical protein STXM2123_4343 [Streptomyces sp. F-3]|nr:hypothetical protein STXM2123_4343 [Streptomyces sp. F-3]